MFLKNNPLARSGMKLLKALKSAATSKLAKKLTNIATQQQQQQKKKKQPKQQQKAEPQQQRGSFLVETCNTTCSSSSSSEKLILLDDSPLIALQPTTQLELASLPLPPAEELRFDQLLYSFQPIDPVETTASTALPECYYSGCCACCCCCSSCGCPDLQPGLLDAYDENLRNENLENEMLRCC